MRDYMIRRDQRQARASGQLCECGHPLYLHHERPAVAYSIVEGAIVETPNPEHQVGAFHCDSCSCERRQS